MGFRTVVISVYRPAWNDFRVETVHGSDEGRETLLGQERTWIEWEPLFDLDFERHGCFFLPWDQFDWSSDTTVSFVPDIEVADDPDAWHPEDALFVPLRHSEGHILGVMSVDEPTPASALPTTTWPCSRPWPTHAAQAIQDAQAASDAGRHRTALEHLLRVSARLTETLSIDAIMQEVCDGIRAALGFNNVSVELIDPNTERAVPRAVVGWTLEEVRDLAERRDRRPAPSARPAVRGRGLLPAAQATRRAHGWASSGPPTSRRATAAARWPGTTTGCSSRCTTARGELVGVIWADEPEDRLLPSTERLQALRMFANQAATAVASVAAFEEMQFLADHDPLTRVGNRRAFTPPAGRGGSPARHATGSASRSWCSTSTASSRSTTATATSRGTWRWRRSETSCAAPCAARTPRSASAATSSR